MIRNANKNEIEQILTIYFEAKKFLRQCGNFVQWQGNFPPKELLLNDIENNQLYVYENETGIHAVFALIFGDDPTYSVIENGSWISFKPYATIHRVASDRTIKGITKEIISFSGTKINHLRIDTYIDNHIMRHILQKNGFSERGTIYISDGTPRIAYEKVNYNDITKD